MKTTLFSRIYTGIFTLSIAFMLTIAFVPEGFTMQRDKVTPTEEITLAKLRMQTVCDTDKITSASKGRTTTFSCPGGVPVPESADSFEATPVVQRAEIACTYTESRGKITWTGCTCTANADSNCSTFVTNCVTEGDNVSGNAGSATCKP